MAAVLRGAPIAAQIADEVKVRVDALRERGVVPTLAVIRVGARPDDLSYERSIRKRAEASGIALTVVELAEDCSQEELLGAIRSANEDGRVHGILLFRPLPKGLDEDAACRVLDPAKDVDCLTASSLFGVFSGQDVGFPPCTAQAVIEVLERSQVPLAGANVTVVGRSLVVGRPVSMMLQARDATVTMCHTKTRDLPAACRQADVLVVAAGAAGVIGPDAVRPGQVVVDVGVNWDEAAGRLVGDVRFDEVEPIVSAITPVPGGLGAVTTAVLCEHVVAAAERAAAGEE